MSALPEQLRVYVIRPILERAELWSQAAENLVLGTAMVESGLEYVDQMAPGPGPAYGFWQIEQATYESVWDREIHADIRNRSLTALGFSRPPPVDELYGNLFLGALTCRLKYLTARPPLPEPTNSTEMARYWKQYYNSPSGGGKMFRALPLFSQICIGDSRG